MDFRPLPKLELHCHLDGCLRLETAREIALATGMPVPDSLRQALIAPGPGNGGSLFGRWEPATASSKAARAAAPGRSNRSLNAVMMWSP